MEASTFSPCLSSFAKLKFGSIISSFFWQFFRSSWLNLGLLINCAFENRCYVEYYQIHQNPIIESKGFV